MYNLEENRMSLRISVYIWDVMPKKLFIIHVIIYFTKKIDISSNPRF